MRFGITALILVIILSVMTMIPAVAEETAQSQIERAVVSYAAAGTRDEQALAALAAIDPALGEIRSLGESGRALWICGRRRLR